MRSRHWVFEAFNLDEEQQEDGWMKQGHPYVGKKCRRIYEGEKETFYFCFFVDVFKNESILHI